jgi:TPR repeat protein
MRLDLVLTFALSLAVCSDQTDSRSISMADLPKAASLKEQLAFTCAYEKDKLPELDPELDQLYKRAVWTYKQNRLKDDPAEYAKAERLYRIAAAHGHWKAMHNLTNFILRGRSVATGNVDLVVDMTEDLIRRGIPQGYYNMGLLLGSGYGVKADESASLQYFRKAADLGNPEAQFYIGKKLEGLSAANPVPYNIGNDMIQCAGEQGHSKAASETGSYLSAVKKDYPSAVKYYHLAVKAGSAMAAWCLHDAFLCTDPTDRVDYLGLEKDEERSRRYGVISHILSGYDYLDATVDELDEIVPLPPAKLPDWDGQIQWVKEWEKNETTPPPLPSEERIAELARQKGLDPETGRKLPPKVELPPPPPPAPPPSRHAATGDPCPQSGLWCSIQNPQKVLLEKGQPMPEVAYNLRSANPLGRLLGLRRTVMGPGHWEWKGAAKAPEGKKS